MMRIAFQPAVFLMYGLSRCIELHEETRDVRASLDKIVMKQRRAEFSAPEIYSIISGVLMVPKDLFQKYEYTEIISLSSGQFYELQRLRNQLIFNSVCVPV